MGRVTKEMMLMMNDREYCTTWQTCQMCRNAEGRPMKHSGQFVCIPIKHADVWKIAIERALNRKIDNDLWRSNLNSGNLRVAAAHIAMDREGKFNRTSPSFIEGSFLCDADIPLSSQMRTQNCAVSSAREIGDARRRVAEQCHLLQRAVADWLRLSGRSAAEAQAAASAIEDVTLKVTDQPGEVAIGEKQFDDTMTQSARGPPSYTAQVRELVLLLASLSMSVRKIAVAVVEAFCGLLRDGDVRRSARRPAGPQSAASSRRVASLQRWWRCADLLPWVAIWCWRTMPRDRVGKKS